MPGRCPWNYQNTGKIDFFVFMGIPQKMSAVQPAIYIKGVYGGGAVPCVFWVLGYRLRLMDVIASSVSLYPNVVKLITIQVRYS